MENKNIVTVADYTLDFLSNKGIDTTFMVTGGLIKHLTDALYRNGKFDVTNTHQEMTAAMSADAYGRLKNKPALLAVTGGPGCTNAITGVTGAYIDSSPVFVISGNASFATVKYENEFGIRQLDAQAIDIIPIISPITKYCVTLDDPNKIAYHLERAWYECMKGRKGPVWLDIPVPLQNKPIEIDKLEHFMEPNNDATGVKEPVDQLVSLLKKSKRPLVFAGQGISLSGARNEFTNFITKCQIPVVTSWNGLDVIENDNELFVGHPGTKGDRAANITITNADLIIVLGARLPLSVTSYSPEQFGKNATLFHIDIDEKELANPYISPKYKIRADCKEFLTEFLSKSNEQGDLEFDDWSNWKTKCLKLKNSYPTALPEYKNETPINEFYFTDELSKTALPNSVILADAGSEFFIVPKTWRIKKEQKFILNGSLGSMGYWPFAIGAAKAEPSREIIVVTGDGSLEMNVQELATIKHKNLPIKLFVYNNNGYLSIKTGQHLECDDRFLGVDPASGIWFPDTLEIAKAYGISATRIDSVDNLEQKLMDILSVKGPIIVDVRCKEIQEIIPDIRSEKLVDGTLVSHNYEDMYPYLDRDELAGLLEVD
jgi:acetolactate synthase-1/2/3 large subunit